MRAMLTPARLALWPLILFCSMTQAQEATRKCADAEVRVIGVFPPTSHPRIVYPMLVLKNATPAARSFAEHLASDAARATWTRLGFTAP